MVKNAAAHHAISAKFPKKIDNKGKTLVVQYEVKLQGKLDRITVSLRENSLIPPQVASNVVVLT